MNKQKLLKMGAISLSVAVLGGALVYYNFFHKNPTSEGGSFDVGSVCPDFTVGTYQVENGDFSVGEDFTLSENAGKVYVLNFWETWCIPCVKELPEFDEFYKDYAERGVEVLAIAGNTSNVNTLQAWLNRDGWKDIDKTSTVDWREYTFTIAIQKEAMSLYNETGGTSTLPRTIILDKTGTVTFIKDGAMTYEKLEEVVLPLLEE